MTTTESLTPEQVQFFKDEGYLFVPDVFNRAEVDAYLAAIAALTDNAKEISSGNILLEPAFEGREPQIRIAFNLYESPSHLSTLPGHPKILDRLQCLMGETILLHHSKLMLKNAKIGSAQWWHQDFAYWPKGKPEMIACMIYLDDATRENGCLQVVPKSHKWGLLKHERRVRPDGNQLELVERNFKDEDVVYVEAPAGSILFFDCLLLHASDPNPSDKPRRTAICEYNTPGNMNLAHYKNHEPVLRGHDSSLDGIFGSSVVKTREDREADKRATAEVRSYRKDEIGTHR